MFRFKGEIVNNCIRLWDEGIAIDSNKFKSLVYYYCTAMQININPRTQQPRTEIKSTACMTKLEWLEFENILLSSIAELQAIININSKILCKNSNRL